MILKELRKQKGVTQKQVAEKINVPYTTYNCYETDKAYPSIETLKKLADYFEVSIDTLVEHNSPIKNLEPLTKEELELFKQIKSLQKINFYLVKGYVLRILEEEDKNKRDIFYE